MSFIVFVIVIAVGGLIVGALARLALPGKDPMTLGQTMLIGIGGSLVAGPDHLRALGRRPRDRAVAVLFATVIVYFIRRSRGGGLTRPGPPAAAALAARLEPRAGALLDHLEQRREVLLAEAALVRLGQDLLRSSLEARSSTPGRLASSRQRRTSFSMCSSLNSVV